MAKGTFAFNHSSVAGVCEKVARKLLSCSLWLEPAAWIVIVWWKMAPFGGKLLSETVKKTKKGFASWEKEAPPN